MKSSLVVRFVALCAVVFCSNASLGCGGSSPSTPNGDSGVDSGTDAGSDAGTFVPATFSTSAATYLHSSADGIDFVVFDTLDPLTVTTAGDARAFASGKIASDGSTTIWYGTYELDGTGHGTFHITTIFDMPYETGSVAGRAGASRTDLATPYDYALVVAAAAGSKYSVTIDTAVHDYTPTDTVVGNLVAEFGTAPATAFVDAYQLYSFGLTLTQARILKFGGLGMTRYIGAGTTFPAMTSGNYSVQVQSAFTPTATLTYSAAEDLPTFYFDGSIVTMANLQGSGPMSGTIAFEFRSTANRSTVLLSGSVGYANISVTEATPSSGNYAVTVTGQSTVAQVPYNAAAVRSIANILPVSP